MSQTWLSAMGIDPPHPLGVGRRTLLGHRLVLALRSGPKTMRELHAAVGRKVLAADLRSALCELSLSELASSCTGIVGPRGGRPSETWRLRYPGSTAVAAAAQAVAEAAAAAVVNRRRRARRPRERSSESPIQALRRLGIMPPEGGRRPPPRRKPVPEVVAEELLDWICQGQCLRDFCRQAGRPSARTIYYWAKKSPDFARSLATARDVGEFALMDEIAERIQQSPSWQGLGGRPGQRDLDAAVGPFERRLRRWRR